MKQVNIIKTLFSAIFIIIFSAGIYFVEDIIGAKYILKHNIQIKNDTEIYQSPYPDYDLIKNLIEKDEVEDENGFYKISLSDKNKILQNISPKREKTSEWTCLSLKIPETEDQTNRLKSYLYIEFSKESKYSKTITPEDRVYFSTQKIHKNNCREKQDKGGYLAVSNDANLLPTPKSSNSIIFLNMNSVSFEKGLIERNYNFKQLQMIEKNNGKILIRIGGKAENGNIKIHKAFLIYKCEDKSKCIAKVKCESCEHYN